MDIPAYTNPNQEESLARMHYLVENRRRAGILLGEPGVGKSTLLRRFAREVRRLGTDTALVDLLGASDVDFLWNLAARLGAPAAVSDGRFRLWRAVSDRLLENRLLRAPTVVLLDHLEGASADVVAMVVRLIASEAASEPPTTCVIASETSALLRLDPRLLDLIELRIDLEPWTVADTASFVDTFGRPEAAGGREFSPAATQRLHELTGGVPRKVAQVASLSRLAADAMESPEINPAVVETVCYELCGAGPTLTT